MIDLKKAELTIRNLKGTGKQYEKALGNGLTVVVSASTGLKTLYYLYKVQRRNFRVKLGVYPHTTVKAGWEALQAERSRVKSAPTPALAELNRKVQADIPLTVADLSERYKQDHLNTDAVGAAWRAATVRYLDKDVVTVIGEVPLRSLTRDIVMYAVAEKHKRLLAEGLRGTAATKLFSTLTGMLNWGAERGYCPAGLLAGVRKPVKARERKRVLSREEVGELWLMLQACKTVPRGPSGALYAEVMQVLLLTGARISEIVGPVEPHRTGLTPTDVDLREGVITLDDGKNEESARVLPMPSVLKSLVEGRLTHADDKNLPLWCLPASEALQGADRKISQTAISRAAARVRRALKHQPPWSTHDFRRSAITIMAKLGVNGDARRAISGHKTGRDVHDVHYNHAGQRAEMTEALTKLQDYILSAADEVRQAKRESGNG